MRPSIDSTQPTHDTETESDATPRADKPASCATTQPNTPVKGVEVTYSSYSGKEAWEAPEWTTLPRQNFLLDFEDECAGARARKTEDERAEARLRTLAEREVKRRAEDPILYGLQAIGGGSTDVEVNADEEHEEEDEAVADDESQDSDKSYEVETPSTCERMADVWVAEGSLRAGTASDYDEGDDAREERERDSLNARLDAAMEEKEVWEKRHAVPRKLRLKALHWIHHVSSPRFCHLLWVLTGTRG